MIYKKLKEIIILKKEFVILAFLIPLIILFLYDEKLLNEKYIYILFSECAITLIYLHLYLS